MKFFLHFYKGDSLNRKIKIVAFLVGQHTLLQGFVLIERNRALHRTSDPDVATYLLVSQYFVRIISLGDVSVSAPLRRSNRDNLEIMNGLGAGCVQRWIRSAEPPGEHRYENRNNNLEIIIHIFHKKKKLNIFCDPPLEPS